jgi:hypothetical protein
MSRQQMKARGKGELPLVAYKNTNFYEKIPKSILDSVPKLTYDNESVINVALPSGIILCGSTGGGKTNLLINFMSIVDSFQRVSIYARHTDEPLYTYLIQCLETAGIECDVHNDLTEVIDPLSYDKRKNNLVIVDDFMSAPKKSLEFIESLFSAGRHTNITPIWVTQSWFATPIKVRLNASYIMLFKLKSRGDARRICSDTSLDADPDEIVKLLAYIQSKGQGNFMLLDTKTTKPELKVRINWGDSE